MANILIRDFPRRAREAADLIDHLRSTGHFEKTIYRKDAPAETVRESLRNAGVYFYEYAPLVATILRLFANDLEQDMLAADAPPRGDSHA